jgi:hypothetical protein
MAFSKPGPKYRVTKMVEARKLHPKSLIPLSEPPLQLPFTAILEGLTLERDNYRFFYLGLPYQCPQKVMKSAIEKIEDNAVQAASDEEAVAEELVAEAPVPAARTVKSSAAPPPDAAEGFVWQQVTTNHGALQRAKVPGGWLVKLQQNGLCFYPDANHKWDGSTID